MTKFKKKFLQNWDGTQADFCRKSDLDIQRFNRVLNGKEQMRLSMARKLKKHLGLTLDEIFDLTSGNEKRS